MTLYKQSSPTSYNKYWRLWTKDKRQGNSSKILCKKQNENQMDRDCDYSRTTRQL